LTEPGREHETGKKIVGAIMGEMRTTWHSKQPFAEHLGGFSADEQAADLLRAALRQWARGVQHATCIRIDGGVESLR
jgi:hypothetical protein